MLHVMKIVLDIYPNEVSRLISTLSFGFITACIGIIPPGLINITAAKVNLKEGKRNALFFVLGAVFIIGFQSFFAVSFVACPPDLAGTRLYSQHSFQQL